MKVSLISVCLRWILLVALVGTAASSEALSPFESQPAPQLAGQAVPTPRSQIDKLIFSRLEQLGIQPANMCSDAVFVRRAYLDVIGALPADGTYYLQVCDAQHKGGEAYSYRLRISQPRPDFELRVVPSTINARAGTTVPITVYALRKDGFSGDIALSLKDAPSGFALSGGRVPADKDQVKLSLKAPPTSIKEPVSLCLEGRAIIQPAGAGAGQGREIVRQAVPADDMMQAFFYRHLVPAKDLKVAVIGRAAPSRQGPAKSPPTKPAPH